MPDRELTNYNTTSLPPLQRTRTTGRPYFFLHPNSKLTAAAMPPKRNKAPTSTPKSWAPTSTPCPTKGTPSSTQTKQKKAPIAWDKDGEGGMTSIRILLDWLAVDGNYQRWRGDTKAGSTKAALANEILAEMAEAGITHRDNKGVQTKVQELQASYAKASDFLRNTGSGLLDEDVDDGITTLPMGLAKICKYWDELHPIMFTRTVSNPPVTTQSTNYQVPNLLGSQTTNDSDDDKLNPVSTSTAPPTRDRCPTSEPVEGNLEEEDPDQADKTKPRGSGKKKATSKDPLGLEQIIRAANDFRQKSSDAREKREAAKAKIDANLAARDRKRAKRAEARKKKALRYESRKIHLLEMETRIKMKRAEMDEVRERFAFVRELRGLGHMDQEIEKFIGEQFKSADGPGQAWADSSDTSVDDSCSSADKAPDCS
ncbi:hypothetical protein PGT21_022020 [Puccinia graminis f. sp. tritici]|uniref:Uncharacterized protein n=1 Tax=Puccinia graminis f. sp. tritici TaxID=56615 RepID=A0A5B0M7Q5_PUCGR|nr:hypothetical protein PGTUg99_010870 [Puccinia graminis f. sp. tritici]KAA1071884.1 hypothetical protein PGT21_022020 [Puccinia graminis f. sp. tritici]